MDKDGDFSAYVTARWRPLVRSAVVLGCTFAEADDVAQTALLRCYVAWDKVCRADDRDAYVYRVLLNTFRDSRRRRWWGERPTNVLPDQPVADRTSNVDISDALNRALAGLSRDHREVVVLRYYANLTEAQTAATLGVATGTIKSRLSRAMTQLALSPHLSDPIEGQLR